MKDGESIYKIMYTTKRGAEPIITHIAARDEQDVLNKLRELKGPSCYLLEVDICR